MKAEAANAEGIRWQTLVAVLCAGWVVIWIYRTALTPIYPQIQASFNGISDAEVGAIASFYFLSYCVLQVPCGMLADKFGQKAMLLLGFGLFFLATLGVALTSSLTGLYIASLLAGAGCASFFSSAYSLSSLYVPLARRALANAMINSGSALGMGLGLVAASVLVTTFALPWQWLLFGIAALSVVMMGVFARTIPSLSTKASPAPTQAIESPTEPLFSYALASAYFLYFCTCYGYYLIVTWLPSYLQNERGFEGAAIGMTAAIVAFAGIPGALFFSQFADKYRDKKVALILVLQIAAAAMLTLMVYAESTSVLFLSLGLYGLLGKLAIDPLLIAYVSQLAPKARMARALSLLNFFGMSSAIVAPALTGWLSDVTGTRQTSFYLSAVLILIGSVAFGVVSYTKRPSTEVTN
ncbi:MFS transporter [Thaumasiovibrio subtropicus]|uniref:MFS transporter n=1 Tax=Thaumasiovibrio subtropicus TaxID=1891207 RepID=UPI000B35A242|nr:MFS transporter [Thaumasiovibrio subtropicus]